MTDPKKPRAPRNPSLGQRIDRLLAIRAAGERSAAKAAAKVRARFVARWDAEMADVPEELLPAVRSAIAATDGSVEEQAARAWAAEGSDAEYEDAVEAEAMANAPDSIAPTTTEAADLPRGATEYTPGPAARAARGAR